MQKFMQSLEYRIDNSWQPLYNATNPNAIYYSLFGDKIKDHDVDLPYGDELIDVKVEDISDAYLDVLADYTRAETVMLGIYAIFRKRKKDAYFNTIV